jgi:hypothetical protein
MSRRPKRRSTSKSWRLAQSLRDRVTELLALPLAQGVHQVLKDGKTFTTIITPAWWNYSNMTAMAKLVVELGVGDHRRCSPEGRRWL